MNVGIILARGGSKGVPNKNIVDIAGRPLLYYMLDALSNTGILDKIYVSTNCDKIEQAVLEYGKNIQIFRRSEKNAADHSSSEDAILEFLENMTFSNSDILFFAQATSPLTTKTDILGAFDKYKHDSADALLTVVRQKRFIWHESGTPANYDFRNRPRRQEFKGYFVENGALYITTVGAFIKNQNRLSGKISLYEMSEETMWEVDEDIDVKVIESLVRATSDR